jgi:HAD superfamily hydrolase (TIGR01509 family)
MIRALIFDFDGLILDTETPDLLVWQSIYRRHGQELSAQTWGQIVGGAGTTTFEPDTHLESLVEDGLDLSALRREADEARLALILRQQPLPGVSGYLDEARRLRLPLGIASSSPHSWVDGHLARLGILDRFAAVVCGDDVPPGRTKPHPDVFLKALAALGAGANETIVFEDSPNGVKAARAAGLFVVAVPNPLTAQLPFDGENLRLGSLAEISLSKLLAQID